ncbi:hypothetical protein KJA17_02440 [Patescibacteria group bacterium]|nr:hypothetical protein [Patescibacteria group bacterium]
MERITIQQAREYLLDRGNEGPILKDSQGNQYSWDPLEKKFPFARKNSGGKYWIGISNIPSKKYLELFVKSRNKRLKEVLKNRGKDLKKFGDPRALEIKGQGDHGVHLGFKDSPKIKAVFYLDDGGLQVEGDHPEGLFQG